MHYSQEEKYEIIRLVEDSELGVNRALRELKINKTSFYKWSKAYNKKGMKDWQGRNLAEAEVGTR